MKISAQRRSLTEQLQSLTVSSVVNDTALSVQYQCGVNGAPGHWCVVAEGSGATFPASAVFNVIVGGAPADACRDDSIFADGFDG
jgi:hypothetical protein